MRSAYDVRRFHVISENSGYQQQIGVLFKQIYA